MNNGKIEFGRTDGAATGVMETMLTKKPDFAKQSPGNVIAGNPPPRCKHLFLLKYGHFPEFQDYIWICLMSPEGEDSHDLRSD